MLDRFGRWGRISGTSERIETGTWRIENNRLIGQWDSLKGGEANSDGIHIIENA